MYCCSAMKTQPLRFLAALLFTLALSGAAVAEEFLSEVPDLPLMDGLLEIAGESLVFDKPEGRIVEAYAAGSVTQDAVIAFYRETLPQLGWSAEGPASYLREGERLVLSFTPGVDSLTVRFSLSPQ